jgi:hypothetical protein
MVILVFRNQKGLEITTEMDPARAVMSAMCRLVNTDTFNILETMFFNRRYTKK